MIEASIRALTELLKIVFISIKGSEKRRMKKAINYGEKYILTNEGILSPEKKVKRLEKYRDKFFKYN